MIKDCKISEIEFCKKEDDAKSVAKKMKEHKLRNIFIVDEEQRPVGIISTVDFTYRMVAEDKKNAKAKDIMTSPIDFMDINKDEEFALKIMMERNSFICPVVDDGKLVGTVDYTEIFEKVKEKVEGGN